MLVSRRALLIGSAALPVVSVAANSRASAKARLAEARTVVTAMLAAEPIPALSIAVIQGKEVIWAEAFGKANLELAVPATTAHRFRLGSVSKILTATLAARLATRGVVDLDAGIAKYLPDLPEQHRATTLRQLLTHRGGIRHYLDKDSMPDAAGAPIDYRDYASNAEVLAIFINDPLVAKPGERVSYSTFGYTLISIVLEAAAKTPFLELIQSEIARPMALTSVGPDAPYAITANRVTGYHPAKIAGVVHPPLEGPWANILPVNPAYKWAGGGLLATPTDLARFGAAHWAPGALDQRTLADLFTVQTQATERSPPLGLGWRIDEDPNQRLRWHHAGGQNGARASLVVYPKEKLSIAFATNLTGAPGDVNGPTAKIANALLGIRT
jgi:CubicO group peptidase (beta-lactamase class C family)